MSLRPIVTAALPAIWSSFSLPPFHSEALLWELREGATIRHGASRPLRTAEPEHPRTGGVPDASPAPAALFVPSDAAGDRGGLVQAQSRRISLHLWGAARIGGAIQEKPVVLTETLTLEGPQGPVLAAAYSADGRWLASAGNDGRVIVWDPASRKELARWEHEETPLCLSFAGSMLAIGFSGGKLHLRDPSSKDRPPLLVQAHTGSVAAVAASQAGDMIATGGIDGAIRLWNHDLTERGKLPDGHGAVRAVLVSADGRRLATAATDRAVRVWDAVSKKEVAASDPFPADITCLASDRSSGAFYAGCSDGKVRVWVPGQKKPLLEWMVHSSGVSSIATGASGAIYTGDGSYKVGSWTPQGKPRGEFEKVHIGFVPALAAHPSRDEFVSGAPDGFLMFWRGTGGAPYAKIQAHRGPATALALSPDGRQVIAGGDDRFVRVWDLPSGRPVAALYAHTGRVRAVLPLRGLIVSTGDDGKICVWDARSERRIAEWKDYKATTSALAAHPSGYLVVGGEDGTIHVLDPGSKAEMIALRGSPPVQALAVSGDGRWIVSFGDDRAIRIWDVSKKSEGGRISSAGMVFSLALTPDNKTIVAAGSDGQVTLWDLMKRERIATFARHEGGIPSACLAKNGSMLVTADGKTREVRFWDLKARSEIPKEGDPRANLMAVSSDGRTLVCVDSFRIRVWKVQR